MARRRSNQQPVRVPTGGPLGQRKQLEQAQSQIPLPRSTGGTPAPASPPAGPSSAGRGGAAAMPPTPAVFDPTSRPNEPLTAGAAAGPGPNGGMLPNDDVSFLRAIATVHPSPGILRLLERAAQRKRGL